VIQVLVSDPIQKEALMPLLENPAFEVKFKVGLKPEELAREMNGCQVLLVRSETKVTAQLIESARDLKLVGRAGVGIDNIDVAAASKKGVIVMNVPGGNTISAAEHAIAMMLALARNIPQADASVKVGLWERKKFIGAEVTGKVLGVLGLGRIGREVTLRALGLGMRVVGYDPMADPVWCRIVGMDLVPLIDLYRVSDFITLHMPFIPSGPGKTLHFVDSPAFAEMKEGVRLINCARGGLVSEAGLLKALESGKVKGAALDVFEQEPPKDSPLLKRPEVVLTPHLGASTEEAQGKVAVELAQAIMEYFEKGIARNAVNLPVSVPPELQSYLALAERLGRFCSQIVEGEIQRVSLNYQGVLGRYNPAPFTQQALVGVLSARQEPVTAVNSLERAKALGIYVEETAASDAQEYTSLLTLEVKSSSKVRRVSGTVFRGNEPRLVEIDGHGVDIVPEGHMLVLTNVDRPGVIGFLGTLLGEAGVNIAGFDLGRTAKGKEAISVLTLDSPVPEAVLSKIKGHPAILGVQLVRP
jgi:D-3-phosphoglycerate dehydrogenase